MINQVHVELLTLGKTLAVERGASLQDVLFSQGVEFPCGGRGRCKGCRIKVLGGSLPPTGEAEQLFTRAELADGWRLACRAQVNGDLKIEVAQWEVPILADNSVFAFTPQEGLGAAVDLGTTTVAAQLLDLGTGRVLAVRTALNAQACHGADIMSRIEFALEGRGRAVLEKLIREQIGQMVRELIDEVGVSAGELHKVILVGNTVMHHLFSGISVEPLSRHPFESEHDGLRQFTGHSLGWKLGDETLISFLPCLGSFVGSDLLAGVLATRMHENPALTVLVDLGTNGEIIVGSRERLLCASTAAGPAFEGARISCGMRAATGAISEVVLVENSLRCRVLGHTAARGICGSGLVDAVAAALDLGLVQPSGKLTTGGGKSLSLTPSISLLQADIRELQLAKGAIAAGIRILLQQWGATGAAVERVWLAGAFGNYINRASARRIGLVNFPAEKVFPAGNTALLGAKLALFNFPSEECAFAAICSRTQHVSLNEDPEFMDIYVDEMAFPCARQELLF